MQMIKVYFSTSINGHSFLRTLVSRMYEAEGRGGQGGRHGVGGTEAAETGADRGRGWRQGREGGGAETGREGGGGGGGTLWIKGNLILMAVVSP
jgi:hypothetical protein